MIRHSLLAAFMFPLLVPWPVLGDEVKLVFPETATKAFGDNLPLRAEVTRKDGMIRLELVNASTKHVVVTNEPYAHRGHYEAQDGSKIEEFGGAWAAGTIEHFNHVVLRPETKKEDCIDFSSCPIWEIDATHEKASLYIFEFNMGGYFPTIGEYLRFTVTGSLALDDNQKANKAAHANPLPAPSRKPNENQNP